MPALDGYWYEIVDPTETPSETSERLAPVLSQLLSGEVDTLRLAEELADRHEEIELLYTISEVLGQTLSLDAAAQRIVREVSAVVGSRRGSILVYDENTDLLRPVAGAGIDVSAFNPIRRDDPASVAARVFRERRPIFDDSAERLTQPASTGARRSYRGAAFLSVPILYPGPDGAPRPIGVINLTDRIGTDAFSAAERRLVTAIANQIGAAIENARLVASDRAQHRLRRELELAHDLQLRLLPSPTSLGPDAPVAARFEAAESVGGDFYHFLRLHENQIGVMLGDVSSHGFSAALIMALVLSAAGIHAEAAGSPDGVLRRLYESISEDLGNTEMYLSLFYGVALPERGRLRFANAGHPHAFRIDQSGAPLRLAATAPPLGLGREEDIKGAEVSWELGRDLLVLFSDGVVDAADAEGQRFGERRVLDIVVAKRQSPPEQIVDAVFAAVTDFATGRADDRTVLVLRA